MESRRGLVLIAAFAGLVGFDIAAGAQERQIIKPSSGAWTVAPSFDDKEARANLSGAACAPIAGSKRHCLSVNDEKRNAQFFYIENRTIVPTDLIRLRCEDGDPDAEGVAFADGYFYVTGSHGRSRNKDKPKPSAFNVYRIAADEKTGEPKQPPSLTCAGVEQKDSLRAVMSTHPKLAQYVDKPLAQDGTSIEGLAAQGDRLVFGFRTPSLNGVIFLLSANARKLFEGGLLADDVKVEEVKLARSGLGIRDLAVLKDGMLILAGPKNSDEKDYSVHLWHNGTMQELAALDPGTIPQGPNDKGEIKDGKAEILLLLEETPDAYRTLIMFDGILDGAPTEYEVRKTKR